MIAELLRDGVCLAPPMLPDQVDELAADLRTRRMYDSHVAGKATQPPADYAEAAFGFFTFAPSMLDVVLAPHWFERSVAAFSLARDYFDEFPRLYSINAFWTIPGRFYSATQAWHRDGDDVKQLTLFMFGSDIEEYDDGAHLYQCGTHRLTDADLGRPWEAPPDGAVMRVLGARGTVFAVDTGGIHRALTPVRRPRLLLWARWGTSNPPRSYAWDDTAPVPRVLLGDRYPEDPELREAIRLVVN